MCGAGLMADILIRLKNFESADAATQTASAIMDAGGITYVDKSTDESVNVTVGDVTVES